MDQASWLGQVTEDVIEPDRKICDPHHHLWHRQEDRYLLNELMADIGSGHNVVSTVFVECKSMYRTEGPEAMRPIGETEFVDSIVAMPVGDKRGDSRVCAGIVSFADLRLGGAVGEVLDAHIAASTRFRGIRHANAWDKSPQIRKSHTD